MKQRKPDDALYERRVNFFEDYLSHHPEAWALTPPVDRELLSRLFFAGRKVDVGDVFVYRRVLALRDPDLERSAENALRRFLHRERVTTSDLTSEP